MSDVARSMDELFGSCRSALQRDTLDVSAREELFALLREVRGQDTMRYEEEWVPYLSEFSHHWGRPLVMLDDVHLLSEARQIAPFARFTVNSKAVHRWMREREGFVHVAADLELPEELESQEDSVALWMDALDPAWRESEDRFEGLANSSTGAMFAVWYRPGRDVLEEPEVVMFGDEGQLVGIAPSLQHFAYLMAHTFDPYDPSRPVYGFRPDTAPDWYSHKNQPVDLIVPEDMSGFDGDAEWPEEGRTRASFQQLFERYIEACFGPVPSREELIAPTVELTAALEAWVELFYDD